MIKKLIRLLIGKPRKEDYFVPWRAKKNETVCFQNKEYILKVTPYKTKKGCWDYTLGSVSSFDYDLYRYIEIAKIYRNYHTFWFEWVIGHPDGYDYLICGADYQGVTVIRLDTGERYDSSPSSEPYGFCWTKAIPSPNKMMLAVSGCYWAAPHEVKIYDFVNPLKPFSAIDDPELFGAERFLGWNDNNSCRIKRGYATRKSDGAPYHLLTEEEQDAVDGKWSEREGWKEDEIIWNRKRDCFKNYINVRIRDVEKCKDLISHIKSLSGVRVVLEPFIADDDEFMQCFISVITEENSFEKVINYLQSRNDIEYAEPAAQREIK